MVTATIFDWIAAGFVDFMKKGYVSAVELMYRAKKAFEEYYGAANLEETATSATSAKGHGVKNVLSAVVFVLDAARKSTSTKKTEHDLEIDAARVDTTTELNDADLVVKTWSFSEFCGVEDKDLAALPGARRVDRTQAIEVSLCEKMPSTACDDFFVTELFFDDFCEASAPGRCCMQ